MKYIIGLGNPGSEYEQTRHNIGFEILDLLKKELQKKESDVETKLIKKTNCKIATFQKQNVSLVYPQTFMNLSGQAVLSFYQWFKLNNINQLLIVHDDVALPLGKFKWVKSGGAGGQHGVESIFEKFGGKQNFQRLKFGIGPDPGGDRRAKYVLQRFPETDNKVLEATEKEALKSIQQFLKGKKVEDIMNQFNGFNALAPKKPPKPKPSAQVISSQNLLVSGEEKFIAESSLDNAEN